jgi:hypothetical protein
VVAQTVAFHFHKRLHIHFYKRLHTQSHAMLGNFEFKVEVLATSGCPNNRLPFP